MAVEVISLKCPVCSSPLSGFEKDNIFFCAHCKVGIEVEEKVKQKPLQLSYARPLQTPVKSARSFFLPFFLYRIIVHPDEAASRDPRVMQLLGRLNKVYVPAFSMVRESYYGELGLAYTESGVVMENAPDVPEMERRRIGSAVRRREETAPYLYYYPLLMIDKRADVTDSTYKIESILEQVWAVPFFDLGDQIQEGILGKTFPAIILDTISEFRAIKY